ncbi:glycoside hydrolase family 93 protein [Daldinia caldariorum]|uniref:glycoside hydrolase family 93 protein n=1 Tax=Daldinia caldariorum TaxID=326644 RepID=UPI0020082731|nr:glycoside hydrolase family 93 protein [Daldinia caldariorum]KAI1463359.1 glycoside hydrolase family 93 protein [Daldinia caldariorum]
MARAANMSLLFIFLHCLNFISLGLARPVKPAHPLHVAREIGPGGELREAFRWRSIRNKLNLTYRDNTVKFGEIGASFTLSDKEVKLAPGGTYPRLTRLADGGILAVSSYTKNGLRTLRVTRSDDNGATFNEIGTIAQGPGDLDNGFLLQLPSGTILAAFRNHDKNADGALTYFRITVCKSVDGGRTWAFLAQAAQNPADATGFNGLWEPFLRIGKDGGIQLTYSGELGRNNQETFRTISHDGGATWSQPQNLNLHGSADGFRDGMQGIVAVKDNGKDALVMVFEVKEGANFHVATVLSYDDGNTWGSRSTIYRPQGHNAGAPQIVAVKNNLAVAFMTDEDIPADQLDWANKADIKMIFSAPLSGGQLKWTTQSFRLSEESSYWPGTFMRGDGNVMAVYERGGVPYGRTITEA